MTLPLAANQPDAYLARYTAVEAPLAADRYSPLPAERVLVKYGAGPVLFTAPHAVSHCRDGGRKPADIGTGALARVVAEDSGNSSLIAAGLAVRDGNRAVDGVFKDILTVLLPRVRCVVDLHGMRDQHGPDICLGTGGRPDLSADLVRLLLPALTAAGYTVSVDSPYDAVAPDGITVTGAAHAAGVAGVQVEIANRCRNPYTALDQLGRLGATLTSTFEAVRR